MTRLALILGFGLVLTPLPAAAGGPYVTLTEDDCSRLTRHYPDADVAYKPGRDVRGKAVAPADLARRSPLVLPDSVVIPVEIDLLKHYGIPGSGANFKGDVYVGEVVVDVSTGRATFNGQPLASEAEAELAARCQRILRDRQGQ